VTPFMCYGVRHISQGTVLYEIREKWDSGARVTPKISFTQ